MNDPAILRFEEHYVLCPVCGVLDRHFGDRQSCVWACSECRVASVSGEFTYPEVSDEWIPQVLGTEVSIVQKKDLHGRISCGWFSDTKVLIAEARAPHDSSDPSPVFDGLMKQAVEEAARRNGAML